MKKIIAILYTAILIVMGVATLLENEHGIDWAHIHIYAAWWFSALWGALAVVGTAYFIKMRERRVPVILLHASLLLILLGAFVTHLTGRSGILHLRMHYPEDIVLIKHNGESYFHRLPYKVALTGFEIVTDETGNSVDYRSEIVIDDAVEGEVSMNNIYKYGDLRFYQMGYDDDMRGSTLAISRDPYGIPITYCGYLLLFGSLICLCFKSTVSARLWLLMVGLTLGWCIYYFVLDGSWTQIPVLRSPLLFVHVITIIMAYALLLIQAVMSAAWLISSRRRREGHLSSVSVGMLRLSLCFLALGIFLGAIWANISWGSYWSWDSKEVWALITFMVYAIPAHRKSLPYFNSAYNYHRYMLIAFITVLITYFGVNYFLVGMHSYA